MRTSRIKEKISRDEPALVTTLHLTDPSLFELTSLMGFDGIWMDMEHHVYSLETASHLMRAARVGSTDILARPGNGEFARLSRMLEAGAHGIMYPRCRNADEACEVVNWAKFAPVGRRGFDGANPDAPYCSLPFSQYIREANEQTFVLIQIEDPEALEQAQEIVNVDGVDAIMLGPGDFSILSGIPGQFDHESINRAVEKIAEAARNAGKHWASVAFSADHARRLVDMGARIILHHADILMVKNGLEQLQRDFEPLGFSFDNRLAGN